MNIQWCIGDNYVLDPTVDLALLKDIGAFWGSWRGWRSYSTDNVICYDPARARELIRNRFNTTCNLYIPAAVYTELQPSNTLAFGSEFQHEVMGADEIVAVFLAAGAADIVLLLGYDLTHDDTHDTGYLHQAMRAFPDVQFVLIGEAQVLAPKFSDLDNLTQDTLANVLEMFT